MDGWGARWGGGTHWDSWDKARGDDEDDHHPQWVLQ
jgi:hypothetical protein